MKKFSVFNSKFSILLVAALIACAGCNKDGKNGDDDNIEPPPLATSTKTWKIESPDGKIKQTWSDYISVPACNKSDFNGGSGDDPISDCRSYTYDGTTFYYYSWAYVKQNQHTLCPDPWRMPRKDDIGHYVAATGADGNGTPYEQILLSYESKALWEIAVRDWGMLLAGSAHPTTYWSQIPVGIGNQGFAWGDIDQAGLGVWLIFADHNRIGRALDSDGSYDVGLQVRCVR
jgi:uncharacterized protein (TIGR02145 family)